MLVEVLGDRLNGMGILDPDAQHRLVYGVDSAKEVKHMEEEEDVEETKEAEETEEVKSVVSPLS